MKLEDTLKVGKWIQDNRESLESDNLPIVFIASRMYDDIEIDIPIAMLNRMIKELGIVRGSNLVDWQKRYKQLVNLLETRGLFLDHGDDGKFKLRIK